MQATAADRLSDGFEISASDDIAVKSQPVVEVVKVHRVADFAFIGDAVRSENGGAGIVRVNVACNRGIEFFHRGSVELAAGLFEHPLFELGIGRLLFGDKGFKRGFVEAQAIEHHLIVALAARRIVRVKLVGRAEGRFLPEPRKVQDAERTGRAGADEWDDF